MLAALLAAFLAWQAAPAAAQDGVKPFGTLTCEAKDGYRFCPGGTVKTFDSVPLDTNVALPASGDSNLPLVVMLHGWGGQKSGESGMARWARLGYAVLSYTARGFNGSCGTLASRAAGGADCADGWIKLAHVAWEIQDTQYLAGRLADQGLVDPQRIGATGGSYGGGQSMALAALNDRTMQADGSISPWLSPEKNLPMRIAAAAPDIPWTDLVYALSPNGRTLDYTITDEDDDLNPTGVLKESFVAGLYALGQTTGYYAPPGADPHADLTTWFTRVNAGEPDDAMVETIKRELSSHHSSYYIDDSRAPSPLFISSGFTDDLFPVDEAIRFYNRTRAVHPDAVVSMMFLDTGHQRAQNKTDDNARRDRNQEAFFERYLKGNEAAQPPSGVEALSQTCPKETPSGGPFNGPTWESLHPGEVQYREDAEKSFTSAGSDPNDSRTVDPVAGGGNPCARVSAADDQNTATYRLPLVEGSGYTLLGAPTVIADLKVQGQHAQVAARLWDVDTEGQQTLIARSVYRPESTGRQVFQLHPNAWHFAPGHVAKLELLGRDAPYARPSNGDFTVFVSNLDFRLPVRERPPAEQVREPAPLFVPAGATLAPDAVRLGLRVRYRRRGGGSRRSGLSCNWRRARARLTGRGLNNVRRVTFRLGRKRVRVDGSAPFTASIKRSLPRRARSRRLRGKVLLHDGRRMTVRRRLRGCG